MQATMFEDGMVDLRNAEVSDSRKRETWNWVFDPLVRPDQGEPFTFRSCCQSLGIEVYSMIQALAWQRRRQIDRIFGAGTACKVARAAEERAPIREDDLVRAVGGAK